ncbi:MAG: sodium-extruding oxaloacetate decarboxylase subunit alpha [Porticoccaceae bacterium]
MSEQIKPLGITELVLRDAHQSLFATRMRIDDMLPIAVKLDQVGYWSLETWGGATFDACIRFLGEDPWDRLRELKKAMPNTPQQMLLRGQNILGYRHYADDVVEKFVERAAVNGIDVFRVFDAMNDLRNMETALKAVKKHGRHAQGAMSYTTSPVHTIERWVDMGRAIEDMGADSICIKDMAGLLKPYVGFQLVSRLKKSCDIPIHLHCHATTGLSTATIVKCVEAGVDNVDTSISSMSMTYGHSATEAVVEIFNGTRRQTGLDIRLLEEIAAYFREVRKKYASFEGSLRGVDSRILLAQVPGGMLTNMESQLKEQGAEDRFDEVLQEIPRVREDLGYIPLVTPTSQIVGTQAVINVLDGERYKTISKETCGVLRGEYGATPAPVNSQLQQRALDGADLITCRPADLLEPELELLADELARESGAQGISFSSEEKQLEDVLTYALFPQAGLKFLKNRGHPEAFEVSAVSKAQPVPTTPEGEEIYTVTVEGVSYTVTVASGGDISGIVPVSQVSSSPAKPVGEPVKAPLAGSILRILVSPGQQVVRGQQLLTLEAMKMETAVSASRDGLVGEVRVKAGDSVAVGDCLLILS